MSTLATKTLLDRKTIDTATDTAAMRWRRNRQPDTFITKVAVKQKDRLEYVNVHIHHHETFPLGGQTFTIEVRALPDNRTTPGELLHRGRIHLAAGQRVR